MTSKKLGFLVLALSILLGGCGVTGDLGSKLTEEHKIGDKPAKDYYRQFLYKKEPSGAFPYRYLTTGLSKLKDIDTDTKLYYSMSLYLLEDGNFVFDYEELEGEVTDGVTSTSSVYRTRAKGKWTVDKTSLVIENVGKGAGLVYNKKDTVTLSFDQSFNAPELKGKTAIFFYTESTSGLKDRL